MLGLRNMVRCFDLFFVNHSVYSNAPPFLGDIIYLNALGRSIIVLGSSVSVMDLMEKRSTIYSDRLNLPMLDL